MFLALAGVLFAAFVLNVSIGSFGGASLLGSVGEMLLLFAVSIAFAIAVLEREAHKNSKN